MDLATNRVQEQLGAALMGMAMNLAKEQSATLAKLMDGSALATLRDPALGSNVDLLA
jgi:hypothetical protein